MSSTRRAGWHGIALLAAALLPVFDALAATRGELDQLLDDLVAWLPGEYDSAPLIRLEAESGVATSDQHRREHWILSRVDAPAAGTRVILRQVHAGNLDGEVALEWQGLYAFRVDASRDAVIAERRALVAPMQSIDAHRDPARQRSLSFDPDVDPACDWLWRRRGATLVGILVTHGTTSAPCTKQVDKNSVVDRGEWLLSADELWIRDDPAPALTSPESTRAVPARPESYLRLFKARTFGCSWLSGSAEAPTTAIFELHDRGGEYRVEAPTGGARILRLIRGPMPTERLRGQREVTSLTILGASNDRVFAETRVAGAAEYLTLRFADQFIECARR